MVRRGSVVLLFLVSACGGDDDARGPDGMEADAGGADDFLVTVMLGEEPLSGIDVVFHAPDGTVTGHVVSDAAGEARGDVAEGGQVTIARTASEGDVSLTTFRRLEPGSAVVVRYPRGGEALATATVTLPEDLDAASSYVVENGCDQEEQLFGDPNDVTLAVDTSCVAGDPPTFPVYALAIDAQEGPLAWSLAVDVPVAFPDADLPSWQTEFDAVEVTVRNPPADLLSVVVGGAFDVRSRRAPAAGHRCDGHRRRDRAPRVRVDRHRAWS